ncbi:hypothetical protein PTT_12140 [Pyrenophora teres f. teres 0-1]|uniref:DUF3176 domain containing protein n=1 Tax=Pyrenophora teres f. teres (strain 0-1) TaxID=861557 RepID=E3RT35_PYRTT|nr:hypothetical protein PTT_12140 [Pyrenophora teres f. teres 0-1]
MLGTQDSHLPLPLAQARLVDESSYIPPPPSYRASVHDQPSLDLPQRIEQKLAQYNASENICKRWLFEIASVATSAICMGAIIGLLHYLDNQSLSKWPLGLTIITILSKIASAALILPISEAIGQLKWTWFHGKKSRDAFDFEIFDKASRGAWGSVMLLCRTKGRSLAALGALLTVLLLAIDSFFQQVTDMPERWKLQGASSIPRSIQYTPSVVLAYDNTWDDTPITQMNQDLKRALDPFFYDQNGTRPLATENGIACGYFLNATSESPVLMSGYRVENFTNSSYGETLLMRTLPLVTNPTREALYGGSINFKHINYPLMDALIVSAADGTADSVYRKARPVAHECMLSWCVKTFRSSYAWGGYEEEVVETFMNTTQAQYPWSTERLSVDSTLIGFDNDITIVPPNIEHNIAGFGVSNDTFVNTVIVLDEVFPSLITVSNPLAERYVKIRTSFTDQVMFREVRFNPWLAPNNVTNHMERIAEAMTNTVRSDPNSHELIIGTAFSRETYVMVHWAWLTFPITMLLFSIVFLGATMVKTSQQKYSDIGTYKSSAIPTLMYGLPREIQRDFTTSAVSSRAFSRRSKKVRIRLNPKQGWRVSGQMYLQPTVPSSNT